MIVKTAEKYHFEPKPVDNRFSELVFTKFIELLDPAGMFFTRDEVVQLDASRFALDEEILNKKCVFINEITKLYNRKLSFADSLVNSFKDKKFNFNQADTLTFRKDEIYIGHEQLIDRWEKLVKLQVLSSYLSNADSAHELPKPLPETITKIQEEVIAREICRIKSKMNYSGGIEQYVGSKFLKAVSFAFDPHTIYFSPAEENEFNTRLSKETFSFGLEISRNNLGEIEI